MSYGMLRRWSAAARSAVVDRPHATVRRTFRIAEIERGWLVQDSDGARLGTVAHSDEAALTVSRGLLRSSLAVPRTAIGEVHEGLVRLNVSSRWVAGQGWDRAGRRR